MPALARDQFFWLAVSGTFDDFERNEVQFLKKWWGIAALVLVFWWLPTIGFCQNPPQDFDYLRLAHPEVAEFLDLTDQQRTEIAQKVAGLTDKLAAAPAEQRDALTAELQTQLQAMLTPEQVERLIQLPDMRKLRFNFGSPAWEDVLRWFAKQADLSLVMSTPPTGAFNYTDNREYTPAQAIDLLNSILLTKGFTLVRRDKLLILVEIKDGVPDEIIPRVTLDELDKRGTFEIVNVMFSLGDKPMDTVQAEIKPILGSYGKIAPLPNSKQLLITETAGKLRAIHLLIQSVPSPAPPPAKEPPKPAEPAVLESFVLGNLDPKATAESLKQLAPAAVITTDAGAGKLVAYGPQSQIGVIRSYMEQLSGAAPVAGITPSLQIYRLSGTFAEKQLLEQIAMAAPQSKASVDSVGKRLLVYGVPDQQAQVQKLLSEMGLGTTVGGNHGVQVYHLRRANPTVVSQMVTAVAPQATVTVDAASSAIVVRADQAELDMIGQLIDQLESGGDVVDAAMNVKSFPLPQTPPTEFMTVLQSLAPRAKLQWDAASRGLIAIGTANDLAQVERLIVQLQATQSAESTGKLVTYPLSVEQKTAFQNLTQVLVNELGPIKILSDPAQPQLSIWATEEQHAFVAGIVEQIKMQPDPAASFSLKRLPADVESPDNLLALVKPQFPRATISWNAKRDHLIVWADENDQPRVEQFVARLIAEMPAAEKPQYQWYEISANDLNQVLGWIQPLVPAAKLSIDTTSGRLLVFGKAEDQKLVAETLAQLQPAQAADARGGMKTHPLLGVDVTTATTLLKSLVPRAQVTVDANSQQLIVIGDETTQAAVTNVLQQLQDGQQASRPTDLKFYPLEQTQSAAALAILGQMVPSAKINWDAVTRRLSVIATERDQLRVTELLAEIQQSSQPVAKPQLVVYPLANELRARLQAILAASPTEFSQVKIIDDQRPGELAVMASEVEHQLLAQIVKQLVEPIEGVELFTVVAYQVGNSDPAQLTTFLQSVFSGIKISADPLNSRLLVWAAPSVHQQITKSLAELNADQQPGDDSMSLRSYRMQYGKAAGVVTLLQKFAPRMQLVASDDQSLIIAWGRQSDHDRIKQAVAQMNMPDEPKTLAVELYSTGAMDPQQAANMLSKMFPDISLIPQGASATITVLARGEQHILIRQAMERLSQVTEQDGPLTVAMYRAARAGTTAAIATLTPLLPQAKLVAGATPGQIIGLATANDHQRIQQLIDLLESDVPDLSGRKLRTYQLNPDLAAQVRPVIQQALPTLSMLGTDPSYFATWARDEEHDRLRGIIADAEQQLVPEKKTYQSYAVEHLTTAQARAAITAQLPRLNFVELANDRNLTILATTADHQKVKELLSEVEAVAAKRIQPVVVTYSVPETSLTQLIGAIPTQLSSRATIGTDAESKSLIVTAEQAVHDQLAVVIADLQVRLPKLPRAIARIYAMGGLVARDWQAIIAQVAPTAVVAVDANSGSLVVTALPSVHDVLRGTMDEFRNHISEQKTVRAYRVSRAEPSVAAAALTSLLPNAKISVDATSKSLIVVASDSEQAVVQTTLEQIDLNAPQRAVAQVYATATGDAAALSVALKTLVPSGSFVADPTGKSLLVLASPDEHELIKSSIDQWTQDPGRKLMSKVYPLTRSDPQAAVTMLQRLLPGATLAVDLTSRSVAATATAEQHELIAQTVAELDAATEAPLSKVYPAQGLAARDWQSVMTQLAPGTTVAADPTTNTMIVTARPAVHQLIEGLLGDLKQVLAQGKAAKSFRLMYVDAQVVAIGLTALLPNSKVAGDRITKTVLVIGPQADLDLAESTIGQVDRSIPSTAVSQVYSTPQGDGAALVTALRSVVPTATLVADATGKSILALAAPDDQTVISDTIKQWSNDPSRALSPKVYGLVRGDPAAAVTILQKLLPGATLAADLASRSVAATATSEQHQVIEQTIRELDDVTQAPISKVYPSHGLPARDWQALMLQLAPGASVAADPATKSLIVTARPQVHEMLDQLMVDFRTMVSAGKTLRTYQLTTGDPTAASEALTALLPNAKITADKLSRTLMVVADEADQELAATTLQQMSTQAGLLELRSYIAKDMPAESMARALQNLFKNDTQVSVVAEKDSRAVIAVASPVQHQMIESLINNAAARLGDASQQRSLEIYSVTQGDGKTLVDSLTKLFEKETVLPQISYDINGKRILALALPEQHTVIGKTLQQLVGDPKQFEVFRLQVIEVSVADSAIRSVFRDEPMGQAPAIDTDYDNQALMVRATGTQLAQIREILKQLGEPLTEIRGNLSEAVNQTDPLRVIPWTQDFETIRPILNELWPQLRKNQLRVLPPERIPGTLTPENLPAGVPPNQGTQSLPARLPVQAISILQYATQDAGNSLTSGSLETQQEPPVVLIPESDRLIIASTDIAALNQLQQLLQLLAKRPSSEAGIKNFQVFQLKNAGAEDVATQLKQLFKELTSSRRALTGTPVVITSDDRLNMLIVHGSRTDREVVARLLETLDSPDLPNILLNQPVIVPVRNTDANRLLTILNSLYRTQLSSGGGRKQVAIPEGIAPEVATVLQQVNAATSGPVLTLGVDNVTNAIIVMAPQQLRDQVRTTIEQLDRAVALEPGDQIEIIKFQGSNPQRIQKALDMLLKEKK